MPKSESQIGLLVTKAPPRRGPWPGRQESAGKGRARSTDFPFISARNDWGKWQRTHRPGSHPPPLQPTSNASGMETSQGDGLALSGSPLRIAPTHTVKSNPLFLCVLLSLSVLWVPIVYGFYASEAFFVITMNQSLHEKHCMLEEEGGDVRGRPWGTMPHVFMGNQMLSLGSSRNRPWDKDSRTSSMFKRWSQEAPV